MKSDDFLDNINSTMKHMINILLGKYEMVYQKAPPFSRWIFLPFQIIIKTVSILRLDLWIIAGEEKTSNEKLLMLYAGNEKNKNYLIKLAFDVTHKEDYIGKRWLWKIFKIIKNNSYECFLIVVETHKKLYRLFEGKRYFYIPCWISGEVDISTVVTSLIKKKSLKSDIRRIEKNKLYYEITKREAALYNFYFNMYLPYITRAHGRRAIIFGYDSMKKEFRNCELLLVKKEEEYIAGILLAYTKNGVRLRSLGVKNGNSEYVKDGAIGALLYFSVHYLKEKGYNRVNFGGSRAFLKDGVLQYKKKWGIKITGTSETGFFMKPLLKTPGVMGFLLNNPFIFRDKAKFNTAIFVEPDKSFSQKDFQEIYKKYHIKGISNLFIYKFGEYGRKMQEISLTDYSADVIAIHSEEILF